MLAAGHRFTKTNGVSLRVRLRLLEGRLTRTSNVSDASTLAADEAQDVAIDRARARARAEANSNFRAPIRTRTLGQLKLLATSGFPASQRVVPAHA